MPSMPRVPVTLVPNGVDLAGFQCAESAAQERSAAPVMCGAPDRTQRAAPSHPCPPPASRSGIDATLDLIGAGDAKTESQQLSERLGVGERVHFLGYIPREEIAAHYSGGGCFCTAFIQ